jgi:hypothetical protein
MEGKKSRGQETRLWFRFVILLLYIIDSGQTKKQWMLLATRSGEMSHPTALSVPTTAMINTSLSGQLRPGHRV